MTTLIAYLLLADILGRWAIAGFMALDYPGRRGDGRDDGAVASQ